MTQEHDLGEAFYSAYAAGTLDPALQLLVETQAALRSEVRRELAIADSIGGHFLHNETPVEMAPNALSTVMNKLDALEVADAQKVRQAAAVAGQMVDELIKLPDPLQEIALQNSVDNGWKFGGKGLRILPINVSEDVTTELLRIEPGCGAPRHTHAGSEYTLVVAGGFTDEYGSYGPGDISIVGSEHTHKPVADEGEVCFALAVRDGDLKFEGLLGVIQKIFG